MSPQQIFICSLFYLICLKLCLALEHCEDKTYGKYLGSVTPYRFVGNQTFGKIEYNDCKPLKVWMMVRHGTRNPSVKITQFQKTRLPEIRDLILEFNKEPTETLHRSDLIALSKWSSKSKVKENKKLTHEGEDEMINLAERMQSRFPELFNGIYSSSSYKFKHTLSQRTHKSALYFATGLFGKKTAKDIDFPDASKLDPILRFYKACSKWQKEVKENPEFANYKKEFVESPLMEQTVKSINERLGFKESLFSVDDVIGIYETCAFDTAREKCGKSPWCSLFTIEDLKVFEYAEDIKSYWFDGYGHNITHKQACITFGDIMETFNSSDPLPKVTVYFAHSGTMLKLLAHFQMYKGDGPLTHSEFEQKVDGRKWRSGLIDCFGSNLAFVLYDCNGVPKVLTLHQENIVKLPACPTSELCDMEEIRKYYHASINSCNFDELCENDDDDDEEEVAEDDDE